MFKDLYCFQCSLQFDKKSIYDLHLSVMHDYVNRTESFLNEIKHEPDDSELQIEFVTLVPAKPRSVWKIDTAL